MGDVTGFVKFSIDIAGQRQFSRRLDGLLANLDDLTPVWDQLEADWTETMKAKFAGEGEVAGEAETEKWAPLSTRYAKWKARKFPGTKILHRTGALEAAATNPTVEKTAHSLTLTVAGVPYAIYHQSHEPRESNLPRRDFASLTAAQKTRIYGYFRGHLWAE